MTGAARTLADLVTELTGADGLPVRLRAWDGSECGPVDAPTVALTTPAALTRLMWRPGELGLAQAYATGEIEVHGDLGEALDRMWALARRPDVRLRPRPVAVARVLGALRRMGAVGARPAAPDSQVSKVSDHYDLSNDFYSLILDEQMAYSCGYHASAATTLEDAQRAKLDLVCLKLGLRRGSRHLDIGCGWGALTLHAAEHFGARVTAVTISAEQQRFVRERASERGLDDRVTVHLQDYRETGGEFDAVSAIEMGEHVGKGNYPAFVTVLHDRVRPGGRVLIQQMSRRGAHPGGGPFIESFIAPDMHMRPLGETVGLLEDGGLEVRDVQSLREHYVRTVEQWIERFESHQDALAELMTPEVLRVWRLYLVGGARAFRDGRMGVDQILSVRPGAPHDLEPVRAW